MSTQNTSCISLSALVYPTFIYYCYSSRLISVCNQTLKSWFSPESVISSVSPAALHSLLAAKETRLSNAMGIGRIISSKSMVYFDNAPDDVTLTIMRPSSGTVRVGKLCQTEECRSIFFNIFTALSYLQSNSINLLTHCDLLQKSTDKFDLFSLLQNA